MMAFRRFATALVLTSLPAFAAGTFQRLYSNEAVASSFLQNDWNRYTENYHPNYALDDDPKTAWVEGAPGNGEDQSLTIRFSALKSARTLRVRIRNGYQRSKPLLTANAAPRKVTLSLLNLAGEEVFRRQATLTRTWGWQQVDLSPPAGQQIAFLKLRIESTWLGARYKDACISDVQLLVDSDVPYNAKAEMAKKAALTAWTKERLKVAKYFAALPKDYPFAATHFKARTEFEHTDTGEREEFTSLQESVAQRQYPKAWKRLFDSAQTERIQHLLALAKKRGAALGTAWYRPVATGHVRLPDGLPEELAEVANYLERHNFALFESSQALAHPLPKDAFDQDAWDMSGGAESFETTQLRVEFIGPSTAASAPTQTETAPLHVKTAPRVRELYFAKRTILTERDFYEVKSDFLVCYDEKERPTDFLVLARGPSNWTLTAYSFSLDARGRVKKVTSRQAAYAYPGRSDGGPVNTFRLTTFTPTAKG